MFTGDTLRWQIQQSHSGSGANARTHLLIKPREAAIGTNVVVPTNRRVYHLLLHAAEDFYMPSVAWRYGGDRSETGGLGRKSARRLKRLTMAELVHGKRHHDAYRVKCFDGRGRPSFKKCFDPAFTYWHPTVYDDGRKTILRFPKAIARREAPVLYVLEPGDDQPRLVNYRVVRNYYVLDRLFDIAELRLGKTKKIRIIRSRRKPASRGYQVRCGRLIPRQCRQSSKALPMARDDGRRTYVWLPKGTDPRKIVVTPYVGTEPVKIRYRRLTNTIMLPGVYSRVQLELPGGKTIRLTPQTYPTGGRS